MSSHSTNIQFKSILHQVLKMTPFCSSASVASRMALYKFDYYYYYYYTGGESRTPLIYRFVYDVLSNAVPHTQQALTQLVDVDVDGVSRRPALT